MKSMEKLITCFMCIWYYSYEAIRHYLTCRPRSFFDFFFLLIIFRFIVCITQNANLRKVDLYYYMPAFDSLSISSITSLSIFSSFISWSLCSSLNLSSLISSLLRLQSLSWYARSSVSPGHQQGYALYGLL